MRASRWERARPMRRRVKRANNSFASVSSPLRRRRTSSDREADEVMDKPVTWARDSMSEGGRARMLQFYSSLASAASILFFAFFGRFARISELNLVLDHVHLVCSRFRKGISNA